MLQPPVEWRPLRPLPPFVASGQRDCLQATPSLSIISLTIIIISADRGGRWSRRRLHDPACLLMHSRCRGVHHHHLTLQHSVMHVHSPRHHQAHAGGLPPHQHNLLPTPPWYLNVRKLSRSTSNNNADTVYRRGRCCHH